MAHIKNTSFVVQRLRQSDGKTVEIAPGTFESVDIEEEDVELAAKLRAKTVSLVTRDGKPVESKRSKSPTPTA